MNKKIFLLVLITFFTFSFFYACINMTSNKIYNLRYTACFGGCIEGEANQQIKKGKSSSAVTAVPDTGYKFVKWSDGITDNPRTDSNVQYSINVIAEFEKLNYNVTYSAYG